MAPFSVTISAPKSTNYIPVSPYTTDDNTISNSVLCPRYADADSTSALPSPASLESFDVLDSVAWRRGHASFSAKSSKARCCDLWRRRRLRILGTFLLLVLIGVGCVLGSFAAIRWREERIKRACYSRQGGERCRLEPVWAECVAGNGVRSCVGYFADE